jgi:hypothetical protein
MAEVTSAGGQFVHPLFEPSSYYRLASQESVWFDHGVQSIKDFFLGLYQDRLEEGGWDHGEETPDYGYSDEVNAAIHAHRLSERRRAEQAQRAAGPRRSKAVRGAYHPEAPPDPALLRLDLRQRGRPAPPAAEHNPTQFTGANPDHRYMDSPRFTVDVKGLPARCQCAVLLFHLTLVRKLAEHLPEALRPGPWKDSEAQPAINTIAATLAPDVLEPGLEARREERQRACRLANLLALAPVLAAQTDEAGRLSATVAFDGNRACPPVPPGCWVACCVGPTLHVSRGGDA